MILKTIKAKIIVLISDLAVKIVAREFSYDQVDLDFVFL